MSLTRDDVRHLARLARLRFTDAEEARMVDELGRILDYVDQIRAVDTEGVEPMAHVLDLPNVVRPDAVHERITRDAALANAPDADGEYVRVPRVIE